MLAFSLASPCSFKLYIKPRHFTFLRIFFQYAPPLTLNSSLVHVNSKVCKSDRLYHLSNSSAPIESNDSKVIFSPRSLHIDCIIEVCEILVRDVIAVRISFRRDSVSAKPSLDDSSHRSLRISTGADRFLQLLSCLCMFLLN